MQKFTLSGATTSNLSIDVPLGRSVVIAVSGTLTGSITGQYATAPGTFVGYSPAQALTAAGAMTLVNTGAHTEVNLAVSLSAASCVVIANVLPA